MHVPGVALVLHGVDAAAAVGGVGNDDMLAVGLGVVVALKPWDRRGSNGGLVAAVVVVVGVAVMDQLGLSSAVGCSADHNLLPRKSIVCSSHLRDAWILRCTSFIVY